MKANRFTIKAKIALLAIIGLVFLVFVGVASIFSVNGLATQATSTVSTDGKVLKLMDSLRKVQTNFQREVQEWKDILLRGNDPDLYAKYYDAFEKRSADVGLGLSDMRKQAAELGLDTKNIDTLLAAHVELHGTYLEALKNYNRTHATAGQEVDKLVRGVDRATSVALDKLSQDIVSFSVKASETATQEVAAKESASRWQTMAALGLSLPLLVLLSLYIARGIIRNLASFQKTVNDINKGDFDVRAQIAGNDELVDLSKAFNELLDSRVATLAKIEKENEQLNDSVLVLLRAVAQLARKDLTVKVPVSEDVTGAVSDALNLFSSETAKVMLDVSNISADVTSASLKVQQQATGMMQTAEEERGEVEHTAQTLSATARSLGEIAKLAQQCNLVADVAIKSTQLALTSVNNTVTGINNTRDVIRETEKRIKRLGERSQEISGAVNLINVIAERTHILALNASMHAASAGEAGRGFAVVADEVQRLAENSRQATQQIAALVNNIQVETADTVNTMNDAISQIVEGTRLAEQAGQQMQQTQHNTAELVASVRQIANNSEEQAKTGQELIELAAVLKISSEMTSEKLKDQSSNTDSLVEYAKQLLATVRVFKLPG
ncbi:MAG: HAMP domain-containing methyl-accepting chemotaxis protein [Sideroxydans sp.]|nr:HAMP domain-containing methyl-accepting chemotaxis protein [Sideroxydans sp.]